MADDFSGGELLDSSSSVPQARRQAELAKGMPLPVGLDHDLSRIMRLSKVAASGLLQLINVTTLRKN